MKRIILLAITGLIVLQVHSQDCAPTTPVITAAGSTIICEGGSVTLSTSTGNTWTQKQDFGGTVRYGAVGFSIADKGYIGTGWNGVTRYKDFWEYDPATDAWTQKANFGNATGTARYGAVGVSTATKGYIGLGNDGVGFKNDFWEYDPVANTWTLKTAFIGTARANAAAFEVGGFIYVGTGEDAGGNTNDFYRYYPITNSWLIRTAFPGVARRLAVGFASSTRGYMGTGYTGFVNLSDFYEYIPTINAWATKTPYAGGAVRDAVAFNIGNRGYIGTGFISTARVKTFWEYNPTTDSWVKRADFGGTTRTSAVGFSIGGRGYIGTGNNGTATNDFWEYEPPLSLLWSTGATTTSIAADTTGFYNVTATNHLACPTTSVDIYVGISTPEPEIAPDGIVNICQGGNVLLTATIDSGWTQKADFGGIVRNYAVGFSIGNKGYIGTGYSGSTLEKDFWEYDPATNTWTQKADFGGTARFLAVGFSIGNKGYIGTGLSGSTPYKDFWEYEPATNTWTQKADFGGTARNYAVGFSIGNKGYVGTGLDGPGIYKKDFWEYNPATNTWTQKADFGGTVRYLAVGFSIGNKGYVGTGYDGVALKSDFWEYNPVTNTWTQKANFGGTARRDAVGFSIGNKGYIGTGSDVTRKHDFWEYDPVLNQWTQKANFGGGLRVTAVGFSIGNKGYIGTGFSSSTFYKDFWEYDPGYNYTWSSGQTTQTINASIAGNFTLTTTDIFGCNATSVATVVNVDTVVATINPAGTVNICAGDNVTLTAPASNVWEAKASLTGGVREDAVAFSIGSKGYIGTGYNGTVNFDDLWEYDAGTDVWTQKANFSGGLRREAVGFCIGNKGYIGTGLDGTTYYNDLREYDPVTNTWATRAAFPGTARLNAVGFSIGAKGYVGTGRNGLVYYASFYEYDPVINTWTTKANYPAGGREGAVGFGIGTKGYIGTGSNGSTRYNDFYEFDPVANSWSVRTPFPGAVRNEAVGFSIGNSSGFIGTGWNGTTFYNDFYEFDPVANTWATRANFIGLKRESAVGFSIGNKGYIGTGYTGSARLSNFYEYDPGCTYSWSSGQTTQTISAATAGSYTVNLTDILGCNATSVATVVNVDTPKATINPAGTVNICVGDNVILTAPAGDVWTQKADFGGTYRYLTVGFSIGNKGYIGTGATDDEKRDFWEYDPLTNTWTQKADFGGNARFGGVGFSIGNKGYIGTGVIGGPSYTLYKDFWEYDPITNVWIRKADFGGTARSGAVGFSIGNKGYVGTGLDGPGIYKKDFWEYNPATNTWTQKADFGGTVRYLAVGFSIGNKGYIGTGEDQVLYYKDFWEYDPITNVWIQKADFGGTARSGAVGFSIGNKGYIGTGYNGNNYRDFWEYDPATNTWTQKADLGGTRRQWAVGFSIGNKGYIGTGYESGPWRKDFWEYDPGYNYSWSSGQTTQTISAATAGIYTVNLTDILGCDATSVATIIKVDTPKATINPGGTVSICAGDSTTLTAPASDVWIQKANFGGGVRNRAVGFSIGNKGYIGTGRNGLSNLNDFWEYDPIANVWTQKQNFINSRIGAVGFSIGNKGYIGTGSSGSNIYDDFWEYDPVFNQWNQKANFGGGLRGDAIGFSIGNRGYIGTGGDGLAYKNDFWEYDPDLNQWKQKANFGGGLRGSAMGFSIGNRGYIGTGENTATATRYNDFWEYDPVLNQWNQKANFGGMARYAAVGLSMGTKGYVGTGRGATIYNDFWEYDPLLNQWNQKANFGGTARFEAVGFSIGNKGYIGTYEIDFWEYDPGYNYTWSTGQTTQTINTDTAGTYTVALTNIFGCAATSLPTIVSVNTTNTWPGGGTNNWNSPTNWSCGIVPNHPLVNAVINNGAVPMPVLNANVLVKSLALNGTSTVDINGNTLTINKNITGTGTLKGSASSNLTLKGATGTVNFASGSNVLKDLLLTDTATATLGNALNITAGASPGSVTVNTNTVLTTGGNLTLKSDVNGTARVGILTGNIIGDVTVERYIHTGTTGGAHAKGWQFLATPTTGQSIRQAWQENGTTPAGFGTIITGTGTGFDITTVNPSLKFFNESGVNWTGVTNTNTALQQKLGYMLFVRGDRTVITSGALANNTNMRNKGALFTPFNPPPPVPVTANKFQSFGNPYASRIEFSKVRTASTGINDVFYVWDPKLVGSFGYGGYQTITGIAGYIPTVGTPPTGNPATVYYPAGVPSPYIESGQAVFVKGNGTGGNVNFNENVKATGSRLVNRDPSTIDIPVSRSFIFANLFTNTGEIADGNIVAFENGLSNEVNENDAAKIINPGENFGIKRADSLLAVEARNDVAEADTIFYQIQNLKQLPYQFRFAPVHMPATVTGYLIDRFMNSITPVSMSDSSFINFSITDNPASGATDRFILVFKMASVVPVKIIEIAANRNSDQIITVQWKVENEINIQRYEVERSADGRTFRAIVETGPSNNTGGSADYVYKDESQLAADNFYRIKAIGRDGQIQYSSIVMVSAIKTVSSIAVYPNPVVDQKIYIKFINQPPRNYTVQLTNKLGQLMYSNRFYVDQRNVVKTIEPNTILASGTYQLSVIADDGAKQLETVFVQ